MTAMQVNGEDEEKLPPTISIRTKELAPLLLKWRARNRRVPWSCLLGDALKKELAPLAGKRHRQLVANEAEEAAAAVRVDRYVDMHTKRALRPGVAKLIAGANHGKVAA